MTTLVRPSRPTQVTVAVWLLGAQVIVGVVYLPVTLLTTDGWRATAVTLALAVVIYAGMAAIVLGIALAKRWALIAYIVLLLLTLPALWMTPGAVLETGVGNLVWWVVATLIDAVALVLLLARPARDWFRAVHDFEMSQASGS